MNAPRELTVPAEAAGERLDRVLAQLLPDMTRSAVQRLIKDGQVLVDGAPARASDRPAAGQKLSVGAVATRPLDLQAEDIPLQIVFEDDHLLVVNKPPEMVVHPAKAHQAGTLVNALLGHGQLSTGSGDFRPGIVHRLDRHTSGLLLVAKTDRAHAELSRQVEAHEVHRRYLALVWGHPQPGTGEIRTGFGRHPHHRTMMTALEWGRGREAITQYQTAERFVWEWVPVAGERPRKREASAVECVLQTGRTHQIRVHMAHVGCPIIHDPLYGDPVRDSEQPPELRELLQALPGQALHAAKIQFTHPVTGQTMKLEAPPPEGLAALLQWLRQHPTRS